MAKPKPPTKKKSAAKAAEPKPSGELPTRMPSAFLRPDFGFNILDQPAAFMDTVHACMSTAIGRRKNRPTNFKTLAEIRRTMLPLRALAIQRLIGSYGIPQGVHVDLLGPEHIGKTSFVMWLLGGAMEMGCPTYLQETENKPMKQDRALRFLHTNPAIALKMSERLETAKVFSLQQSIEQLIVWVDTMRGRETASGKRSASVPMSVPLVAAIDTWTKLMSPKEAVGRQDYADNLDAKRTKEYREIGEGSNMGHSKWAAEFGRTLPNFLDQNNLILITVRHQFAKVDMTGPSYMSAEQGDMYNTTSTGGRAFGQNASIQLILGRKGSAKNGSGDIIGDHVRCRVHKQSYGPKGRMGEWILKNEGFHDSPTFIEPGLQFEEPWAKLMADEKLMGVRADGKHYTCEALNVIAGSARELCAALEANEELKFELGKSLKIDGYFNMVDEIRAEIAAEEAKNAEATS